MRELTIDWNGLHSAFQMNMPEVRCFLSVEDGTVVKLAPGDPNLSTVSQDNQHFVSIDAIPSRIQYQWVDDFVRTVTDEPVRVRLEAAINGKGAFRRFKDIMLTLPEERRRWFEFRDQMMRQRIIDWVLEHGIVAKNIAPWLLPTPPTPLEPGTSADASAAASPPLRPEVAAFRHFIGEWVSTRHLPLEAAVLDELAADVGKRFQFKAETPIAELDS